MLKFKNSQSFPSHTSPCHCTEAAKLLKTTYFSGGLCLTLNSWFFVLSLIFAGHLILRHYYTKNISGTVAASIADIDFVKRREGIEELLEDGTSSFLSIASLHHGFRILNTLTSSAISRYVKNWSV